MIKYRYNMSTDPEPAGVNRVQVYVGPRESGWNKYGYLGDTWHRGPCTTRVGHQVYVNWPRPDHGRAHRSVTKTQWRRTRKIIRRSICDQNHYHWFNGDRWRAWGDFRGHAGAVIDLDAFKRLRTMYRRRNR
jgi:hypothetical protein